MGSRVSRTVCETKGLDGGGDGDCDGVDVCVGVGVCDNVNAEDMEVSTKDLRWDCCWALPMASCWVKQKVPTMEKQMVIQTKFNWVKHWDLCWVLPKDSFTLGLAE